MGSAEGNYAVAVPTKISPELKKESLAREIVHRLQMMRRSAGFDISDHIVTYFQSEADINKVMAGFANYIKQETLSRQLIKGVPEEGAFKQTLKLDNYDILLGVKKIGLT
jgi:isoleucyl-tRNA synthetase